MDFLMGMVNDARFHEDEVLLLALLQKLDVKTLTCSLGEVAVESIIESLTKRVEDDIAKAMQQQVEAEANKALGKPDVWKLFFGG